MRARGGTASGAAEGPGPGPPAEIVPCAPPRAASRRVTGPLAPKPTEPRI